MTVSAPVGLSGTIGAMAVTSDEPHLSKAVHLKDSGPYNNKFHLATTTTTCLEAVLPSPVIVEEDLSLSVASDDEDETSESSMTEEANVEEQVVGSAATTTLEPSTTVVEQITPVTIPRRSSVLKPYNTDEILIRSEKGFWKQLPRPDLDAVRRNAALGAGNTMTARESNRGTGVRFGVIHFRAYDQTIGDNPSVSYGPPISLDWNYEELESIDLDIYEATRGKRRSIRQMMLNYYNRRDILTLRCGYSAEELKAAQREANKIKRSRAITKALLPTQLLQEVVESAARKTKRFSKRREVSKA